MRSAYFQYDKHTKEVSINYSTKLIHWPFCFHNLKALKKFSLHSKPIWTKRLFLYGNTPFSGQIFLKGFYFVNPVTYHTLSISSRGRHCFFLFVCLFVLLFVFLYHNFAPVAFGMLSSCVIFPFLPFYSPKMETLVKNPLTSPKIFPAERQIRPV